MILKKLLPALLTGFLCLGLSSGFAQKEGLTPIEKQVADLAAGDQVTIVHFWAPWCENCKAELKNGGWRDFLTVNRDVNVVFVTTWSDSDGRADLARYGVEQPNFTLLHHPNTARGKEDRMNRFLGLPVDWLPSTWVFRKGELRYALNYGEVRFSLLQQLVRDASEDWERSGTKSSSELK
jgi:thiol-disulfide isomerase/thioredoxin